MRRPELRALLRQHGRWIAESIAGVCPTELLVSADAGADAVAACEALREIGVLRLTDVTAGERTYVVTESAKA